MTRIALAGHEVLATSEVDCADPNQHSRNRKSLYVDPVAWLAVEVADRALAQIPEVTAAGEDTAVLAISAHCTIATMRSIAERIRSGRLSPLRFTGANPGLLAGAVCLERQLRGPSLTLTMPPELGRDTALVVAEGWLRSGQARYVLLITHELRGVDHVASCAVLE
ncbi:beta-ketoacyl synthase N-terminal-like domain-containing protein [Actinoallomurus rhizosphaericola]|uniref:beta-ketoacyl synthase N-terminal-like domain-containing protein n=1 Tax=Actinoallomurus rhizosphaericola TaxID=2952536 RepID=UPI002090907B|nr:beta-ketoacyl synthase N-terminal-like domain-containing protein [Actinoallomurus rhizosphaericola]MCO5994306.1 hypothetical protein [Actinoallomurus rhizosphaericola]